LAGILAKKFLRAPERFRAPKNALVFALRGDLGSGKTVFVQGFLKGLGIRKKITSPTFVLIKNYLITQLPNYQNVYHIDCYRIRKPGELLKLGLENILKNPQNVVLIEWAEKIRKVLPKKAIWLKFKHREKENQREIIATL